MKSPTITEDSNRLTAWKFAAPAQAPMWTQHFRGAWTIIWAPVPNLVLDHYGTKCEHDFASVRSFTHVYLQISQLFDKKMKYWL